MTKDEFKTYCFVAALRNCLEGTRLRDEERRALEDVVEESLSEFRAGYAGVERLKSWFADYKIRRYGVINERMDG